MTSYQPASAAEASTEVVAASAVVEGEVAELSSRACLFCLRCDFLILSVSVHQQDVIEDCAVNTTQHVRLTASTHCLRVSVSLFSGRVVQLGCVCVLLAVNNYNYVIIDIKPIVTCCIAARSKSV